MFLSFQKITQALRNVSAVVSDVYFNLVTLLVNTTSTNGAQNNTFLDSSSNAFNVTRNGNMTQGTFTPFSQTGWSNFFDGTDEYLAIADNALLRFGAGAFTLEAWIWRNASGAAHTIYAKGGASTGIVFQVTSTNVLRFTHTTTNIDSTGTISANSWTHVAVVREGTGTNQTKLYINGTQDGQGTVSTNFTQTEEVRIGTDRGATADFNGYISNLRFVKGTALYTTTFTPSTTPLTTTSQGATATEVELLTCQSNRFLDNSSNAFSITVTGTPSVQAFSPFAPTAAYDSAVVGGSAYLDGTGDYLTVANAAPLQFDAGNFTIQCWVYRAVSGVAHTIASKGSSTTGWVFSINSSNQLNWTDTSTSSATTDTIPVGAWTHVAAVRSSTSTNGMQLYINGVSKLTFTVATTYSQTSALTVFAGRTQTNSFNGYVSGFEYVKGTALSISIPTAPPTTANSPSLLLNFTNAGIYDAAAKNDLETVADAQVSTTQAKFGTTSMFFDGNGDYLSSAPVTVFNPINNGNCTVEMWVYSSNSSTTLKCLFDNRSATGTNTGYGIFQTGTTISIYGQGVKGNAVSTFTGNTWTHLAVTRANVTNYVFIGGTLVNTFTYGNTFTSGNVTVGADVSGGSFFTGYIDEVRITNGVARYTSNFTPTTTAFPTQ